MRAVPIILCGLLAASCGSPAPSFLQRASPHEAYAESLRKAGLGETALARDWFAAADGALRAPRPAKLPLSNELHHSPAEPRAYGYELTLQRGRVLRVELSIETGEAPNERTLVFIDLFETRTGEPPRRIASADRGTTVLEHEVDREGKYILRIQPELLRGGPLRIVQRTAAALTFPVAGRTAAAVRSYFGDPRDNRRRDHHGIDIFAPRHTPVLAAADGVVSSVGTNTLGGNVVWVWDPRRGHAQYYAHLEKQAVRAGARVKAGDVIGFVGNSGNARTTAPHLHFGLYSRGEGPIDPFPFVQGARGPAAAASDD